MQLLSIWDGISKALLDLMWRIFLQGPLQIINIFNKILSYLSGGILSDILFGSSQNFDFANLPIAFFIILLIVGCIWVLIFGIQLIILMCKETAEMKVKFLKAFAGLFKGIIFILTIPIIFFLANFFVSKLSETISGAMGTSGSIADALYKVGSPDQTIGVPSDYGPPGNILKYNLIIELLTVWFMLFVILMTGMILVQKVVELMFLFIIAPVFGVITVLDDGARLKQWGEFTIGKFLATLSTLIGWYTFIGIMQSLTVIIYSGQTSLGNNWMAQGVLLFITIAGGGLALIHFSTLIAAFIGESVGMYESMASMKSLGAGLGIGAMAGKMTMKALGFVSKNKGKAVRGSKSFAGTPGFDMNQMNMSQAVNGPATMSSNNMMSNLMTNQFQKMNFGQKIADGKFGQLTRRGGVMGAVGLGTVGLTVGLAKGIANWKQGGFKGFRRGVERGIAVPFKAVGRAFTGWNPQLISLSKEASVTAKQNQNDLLRNKGKELVKQRDSLLQKTDSITNANSKQFSKTHKKVDKLNTKISKHNEYTTKRSDIELIRNTNKAIKQDIKANKGKKL
ncbi:Mbov_0396 family ICE element transmembrane protein [Spiroplasma endosymbiont of Glossina fuscipes fuscipes]|uniref:Mbov_0396 family ICE element transmembrane protein n=1 Tax=Spiroplasma endosymbiont of Glossina fuscipes fuscipes TaxID=2004463 RepID=UPI003C75D3E7